MYSPDEWSLGCFRQWYSRGGLAERRLVVGPSEAQDLAARDEYLAPHPDRLDFADLNELVKGAHAHEEGLGGHATRI